VTVRGEVARAAGLTGAAVVLVGLGGLWAARSAATSEALHQAELATQLLAGAVIEPAISEGLRAGDPAAIEALDRVVQQQVLGDQVLAVRVWSASDGTGTVLYSDDLSGIGEQFQLEPEEADALSTGVPAAALSDLAKEENADQADFDQLLEVYVPIADPSGIPLLFETYQTTDGITATTQRILRAFAPVAAGALLLLGAVGALIAWRLARRLERAQDEREHLMRQALLASEHERRTIAADLHDGVVQDLVGLTYSLDALSADAADEDASRQLAGAAATTRGSVRSLRSLIVEIYPPNLEQVGLAAAIEDLAAAAATTGLAVDVQIDPDMVLSPPTTAAVYRATREAVSNVRRHASAARASVRLETGAPDAGAQPTVVLTVTDEGVGFDPTAVPPDHVGLRLLTDLAGSLGGTLTVESAPGQGTMLHMEVPW
jgi:signal transduction histidine kinase